MRSRGTMQAQSPAEQERAQAAVALGMKVRDLMVAGEPVPEELREPFEQAEDTLNCARMLRRARAARDERRGSARRDPRDLLTACPCWRAMA